MSAPNLPTSFDAELPVPTSGSLRQQPTGGNTSAPAPAGSTGSLLLRSTLSAGSSPMPTHSP
eukprot:CAMPEP_0173457082 /NCGR_PEP_ID=MMETSP1357-20121228/57121_1 /TAXON_ID=77926 /ORGANISM="Hemiselmis rufescens, Strain PCC563" /LENGTH=61 /DNA_ID=CAMNT_0014424361 /DNA_START=23 /DNA_END=205 /DNA_ORIENTATION=+